MSDRSLQQSLELKDDEDILTVHCRAGEDPVLSVNGEEFVLGASEIEMLIGFLNGVL